MRHGLAIVFALCLALLCAQLSFRVRGDTVDFDFKSELDILKGQARYPEFQNRVIAAGSLWLMRRVIPASIPDRSVWYAARTLQAAVGFLVLYAVVISLTGGILRALSVVSLLTYVYAWTPLSHPWEYPSDFLDIGFVALMASFAIRRQAPAMAVTVALAALNRESAAFGGVLWMAVTAAHRGWPRRRWTWRQIRPFVPGLLFVALAAAIVVGVRLALGSAAPRQQLGIIELIMRWRWLLHPTGAVPMMAASVFVFAVLLRRLPRPWLADQRGLLWATLAFAAITMVFSIASELRVWLPCWTALAIALVLGPPGQTDREWMLSLYDRRRQTPLC